MEKIIFAYAINLFLKSIAQFGHNFDVVKAKAAVVVFLKAHLAAVVEPFFEGIAMDAVDDLVILLQDSADLKVIIDDVIAKDWPKALDDLEALAKKIFVTPTPSQGRLLSGFAALKAA